jgi:cytochrome b561
VSLLNSSKGYGGLTKALHWLIAVLFAFQFIAGAVMTRMAPSGIAIGLTQSAWFNWHKSIGLVALAIALVRLANRRLGELPPWAPSLVDWEKRFIHRAEQLMYGAMLVMPLSGFVYVMAGGYGVHLFGLWHLPNPIGEWRLLASTSRLVHQVAGIALAVAVLGHVGLVLRHQLFLRDGLLRRMLPRRSCPP